MRQRLSVYGPCLAIILLAAALPSPVAAQAPAVTVFEGARLITGDGGAPIEDSAFIVEGNRITQVGRKGALTVPAGARARRSHRQDRHARHRRCARPSGLPRHGDRHDVEGKISRARTTSTTCSATPTTASPRRISTGTDMGDLAYKLREEVIPNAARILTVGRGSPIRAPAPPMLRATTCRYAVNERGRGAQGGAASSRKRQARLRQDLGRRPQRHARPSSRPRCSRPRPTRRTSSGCARSRMCSTSRTPSCSCAPASKGSCTASATRRSTTSSSSSPRSTTSGSRRTSAASTAARSSARTARRPGSMSR